MKAFALSLLLGLAVSEPHAECGSSTVGGEPSLTVQFTPRMPVQKAPTSTVYGAIMTSYMNVSKRLSSRSPLMIRQVVDCKYVMVQNVDDNPAQTVSERLVPWH